MVFGPSKTTKSLGLKDPKELDAKVQGAALAVPFAPLENLDENFFGTVNWKRMDWTHIVCGISKKSVAVDAQRINT